MPEVNVHFTKIKEEIQRQLKNAKTSIRVAVAWFTDEDLMTDLIELRNKNRTLTVTVIISDAQENFRNRTNLNRLIEAGVHLRVRTISADRSFLHHKFCVIDSHTIINGSYNWTYSASAKNEENIMVITEPDAPLLLRFNTKLDYYCRDNQSVAYTQAVNAIDANQLLTQYDEQEIALRQEFQAAIQNSLHQISIINLIHPVNERINVQLIENMILQYGDGVNMVKRLITNARDGADPREGFTKLVLWGRYNDLSFESIVLREEFRHLFTPEEIHTCEVLLNIGNGQ
ncbi:phospholipase D-like domain-containing protein [Runella slithyformis]|uniref:phospholipase D n=1 Tax=Runella slithyformis (strain ATCC 29530 / DSM 19594 / LMG 11500 / NCIMB 11436 / LSU 4) TaxID=761193 RepID=A0A7U3ZM35_RUNSL|nr:phospholipase D-like domain-containing protein [Runella slithyformis]AEI49710.1 phospholipase D/transphosphatidylase [Runella slithyformis DSM 19594]